MIKVVLNLGNDSTLDHVFRHLTLYWCLSTLNFILMYFGEFQCYWCVYLCISAIYCIFLCCILCIFAVFLKKIQIENIPVEHHFYCQWRTLSVAHINWVRRRYYAWRTPLRCATDRTHNRGVCWCAPLIINTSGLICVAHHWCTTEAQIGVPQIRVFLVVQEHSVFHSYNFNECSLFLELRLAFDFRLDLCSDLLISFYQGVFLPQVYIGFHQKRWL
jgi:hypothetical protein